MAYYFNTIFDQSVIDNEIDRLLPNIENLEDYFIFCSELFNEHSDMDNYQEPELMNKVILPIVEKLGWFHSLEESKIISVFEQRYDAVLFLDKKSIKKVKK
jgi:hypothetical protein